MVLFWLCQGIDTRLSPHTHCHVRIPEESGSKANPCCKKDMISNHIVSSGILSPVLFLCDIVMVYCHEGGLEIENADLALHDTNYCSEKFFVSYPSSRSSSSCFLPSFQILSLPLLILYSLFSLSYRFPLFPDLAEPEATCIYCVLLPSFRTQI